jgi:hypothetical protein
MLCLRSETLIVEVNPDARMTCGRSVPTLIMSRGSEWSEVSDMNNETQPSGLLISVESLPTPVDRGKVNGAVADNDGND